ncbi:MAG TPA: hypothetical protein VGG48_02875 [Rhizomicrobium sp.]|jgi:hypothetical protein
MSGWKSEIARRPFLAGLFGLLGLSLIGGTAYEAAHILRKHYPPTAFDDLLDQLPDRENAEKFGVAVLAELPSFDVRRIGADLRKKIDGRPLGDVLEADIRDGHLSEVGGWVMPDTLTRLCALAAS